MFFANDNFALFKSNTMEWSHIQQILCNHEIAFSQCINFSKSAIYYSPSTTADYREYLKNILVVQEVSNLGRYLGLPSTFSRSKREDLRSIKQEVWKAIQG